MQRSSACCGVSVMADVISDREEIFQQRVTVLRQNGFGMKLHAFNGEVFVAHTHDFAIGCPGCYFKVIR